MISCTLIVHYYVKIDTFYVFLHNISYHYFVVLGKLLAVELKMLVICVCQI